MKIFIVYFTYYMIKTKDKCIKNKMTLKSSSYIERKYIPIKHVRLVSIVVVCGIMRHLTFYLLLYNFFFLPTFAPDFGPKVNRTVARWSTTSTRLPKTIENLAVMSGRQPVLPPVWLQCSDHVANIIRLIIVLPCGRLNRGGTVTWSHRKPSAFSNLSEMMANLTISNQITFPKHPTNYIPTDSKYVAVCAI